MENRLWTTKDVCRYLGISARTLSRWRAEQVGPPALEFGSLLRYVPEHVRAWALTYTAGSDYWDACGTDDMVRSLRAVAHDGQLQREQLS